MFIHLKVVFQTPDAEVAGRRDFFRRRSDSSEKPTLTPPRMTMPEIRALVTGFIGWGGVPVAGGVRKSEERQTLKTDMSFDEGLT